ncbi:hypothetical protein AALB39_05675 [Lachnospiraceae bacterium 54-53]
MKKKKAVFAALITAGMLTGCLGRGGSSTLNEESSRIFVTEEGTLQTATVETYADQDYYNSEELKAYLEAAVSAYNGVHGQGAVTLDSCSLEKGTARMIFRYGSGEDLAGFTAEYEDRSNQVDSITVTSFSEVLAQSESEGTVFLKAPDGKQADGKELSKRGESRAVVVETQNPVTIQTQGKLLFVSDNVVIKDRHTAQLPQGKSYIISK